MRKLHRTITLPKQIRKNHNLKKKKIKISEQIENCQRIAHGSNQRIGAINTIESAFYAYSRTENIEL